MKFILHKLNKDSFSIYPKIIILHIILVLTTLPGIVLCMGADGHFALENACNNFNCDDIAETTQYASSQLSLLAGIYLDKGHCGPCADIAISIDSSDKSTLKTQDLPSEIKGKVFSPLLNPLPVFVEVLTVGHLPQTPRSIDPQITSLQTFILLC